MSHRACLLLFLVAGTTLATEDAHTTTVGLPALLREVVLPGPELEVREITDRKTPVVVRIVRVAPHGTAFRYDLEYTGLQPGTFDLKDYLCRKDGKPARDLPPIRVTVRSVLPAERGLPNELTPAPSPRLGGYWLLVSGATLLWVIGLAAILLVGRKRRQELAAAARPRTLAESLRPLVEEAMAGRSEPARLAHLERALIAYWTQRLKLQQKKPTEALGTLRQHAEAGPLLVQLEAWLHQRRRTEGVDVTALLAPYRNLPADALEGPA